MYKIKHKDGIICDVLQSRNRATFYYGKEHKTWVNPYDREDQIIEEIKEILNGLS